MKQSDMISAAMKLYYASNLNTYIIKNGDQLVHQHEQITIPPFMAGYQLEDVFILSTQMDQPGKLYAYTNEWDLHYLGFASAEAQMYTIVMGPYLDVMPDIYNLSKKHSLDSQKSEALRDFCNQIQILNTDEVNSYASFLEQFDALLKPDTMPVQITANDKQTSDFPFLSHQAEITEYDVDTINIRYEIERDMLQAVKEGDKQKALSLINSNKMLFSFSERFPNQPLRRGKDLAITLNTLLRTAASKVAVPPIRIHHVSEKFVYLIEYVTQLAKLQKIRDEMIVAYVDLIQTNFLSHYSTLIQDVIQYLVSYYDKKIIKQELADHFHVHPSYLSRKFKQETGLTITAYQQKIRVEKAKFLLKNELISIEDVAWIAGYEDPSYFTRAFKKETGLTPTQYKNANPS